MHLQIAVIFFLLCKSAFSSGGVFRKLEECHSAHLRPTLGLKFMPPGDAASPFSFPAGRTVSDSSFSWISGCIKARQPEQDGRVQSWVGA